MATLIHLRRSERTRSVTDVTDPAVRTLDPDELATWMTVVRTAMLGRVPTSEQVDAYRRTLDLPRCLAAVDTEGHLCGTARAFATDLTVPGGRTVAAAAVSSVGVLPTHRRQGHLTRLMHTQLRDVADRGEPVAVLIAAEYPIYGRFGYGPANEACAIDVDADPDGWRDPPTGGAELVDGDVLAPALIELYDRARLRAAGHITWDKQDWEVVAGARDWPDGDDERRHQARKVLWRDGDGVVQGAAVYSVDGQWTNNRPAGVLHAELVVAATDEAERELVRLLTAVDWVTKVRMHLRPIDDPLPLWRHDGRTAMLTDQSDQLWIRILDTPKALQQRGYAVDGRLVLDVVDPLDYAGGRYVLEVGPDGAACQPTTAAPDLVVPVTALGAAYLGGYSWGRLEAAGWVEERHPGAVARATALFATPRAPWCPRIF